MKRTGTRKLSIKRETLRRLVADQLAKVAGGRATCCTYDHTGCAGGPETDNCPPPTNDSLRCESNCCN